MKLETTKAPKPCAPYSQAIVKGNFIFTSGQIYLTPEGKLLGCDQIKTVNIGDFYCYFNDYIDKNDKKL